MVRSSIIKVNHTVYTSTYNIRKGIKKLLATNDLMSFDTEVRSVYDKETRKEAKDYLKDVNTSDSLYKQAMLVKESSGLSFPSIVNTTHFIFGTSREESHIFVCNNPSIEMFIWEEIAKYEGTLLVHNSLFDLKIMYQRVKKLPKNFIDTSLLVKSMINHVDIWKAKVSLKELMGSYYDPKWVLMEDYEPEDLKNKDFISYCAIDGAATMYLYELILEELENAKTE